MDVVVVTPPNPVVTLDEAKAHLRVDFDDDDDLITGLVAAATDVLDGPDRRLRRCIGVQVLQATLPGFPWAHSLRLPYGPVSAVNDITYIDVCGSEQHLDPDAYRLLAGDRLQLKPYECWPRTRFCRDPVQITYTAGYSDTPPALKSAILLTVGDLYENREAQFVLASKSGVVPNPTVERLIAPFRLLRV